MKQKLTAYDILMGKKPEPETTVDEPSSFEEFMKTAPSSLEPLTLVPLPPPPMPDARARIDQKWIRVVPLDENDQPLPPVWIKATVVQDGTVIEPSYVHLPCPVCGKIVEG